MSRKNPKIAALVEPWQGRELDAHYLGYFECFNNQLFFEAHEVLEALWLRERGQSRDLFFKGLIQLAGAFVHIQKKRSGPAGALFELARTNLGRFRPSYESLDVEGVLAIIGQWLEKVRNPDCDPGVMSSSPTPTLKLISGAGGGF